MEFFPVPVILYILVALGIAAAVGLGMVLMLLGQASYFVYSKFFAC